MNNSTQAQKGFQTFILTLSVSLIIFSVIYYFVTNLNKTPDISEDINKDVTKEEVISYEKEQQAVDESPVFRKLAEQDMETPRRAVLAGATQGGGSGGNDETTQSTPVPTSGV